MRSSFSVFAILMTFTATASLAQADLKLGAEAPAFTLKDAAGKSISLKDYKGKTVVLEWLNFECPFVRKHYDSGNMQKLQATETGQGTVWLSVISSAKGKQGYLEGKALTDRLAKEKSKASAVLIDADGKTGKDYQAKTTPHMFVISAEGKVVYQGAIDDHPSTDKDDIAQSKNYVTAALADLRAGKKVTTAETKAYGCGVKYKD